MTARTFIIGGTVREAREWCRENGVQPYAHTTVIATHERAIRGHTIRREDRVEWLTPVSRALVENVAVAQLAGRGDSLTDDDVEHLASVGLTNMAEELRQMIAASACPKCGYPADSFACRIRHIHMNTGAAKAARDIDGGSR